MLRARVNLLRDSARQGRPVEAGGRRCSDKWAARDRNDTLRSTTALYHGSAHGPVVRQEMRDRSPPI